jgi:hypothetical protein
MVRRRLWVGLALTVAGLSACAPADDGSVGPRASASSPTAAALPTSIPLPDVPAIFVAASAGKLAAFDSVSGHMLNLLTSPPPGQVDGVPRFGVDEHNRRVVYFVRSRVGQSCSDSIWKVPPEGGKSVRVFGRRKFWIRGLTADPTAASIAFSAEDCRGDATGSGVYLLSSTGRIRGHVNEQVPPDTNGQPGAGPLALAGDSLAIFVGSHNTTWIAIAHASRLHPTPRLIDLPFTGLPPKLNHGASYCPNVGPPMWVRPHLLASTVTCGEGTTAPADHTVGTFLVTLDASGQRRGAVVAKVAGPHLDVALLSSDNHGHFVGTVSKESDDTEYVFQVIEISGGREHLLPPCDIRARDCPTDPAW